MTTQAAPEAHEERSDTDPGDRGYRIGASSCAVIAGTVHAIVVPEHLEESWLVGMFFIVVYTAQFGLALALRATPSPRFLLVSIVGTLGLIALYVASRTVELPFLPRHDHSTHSVEHLPVEGGVGNGTPVFPMSSIEPVGLLDLVSLGAELILVALLVGMLHSRTRRRVVNVLMGTGLLALGARAAGLLG